MLWDNNNHTNRDNMDNPVMDSHKWDTEVFHNHHHTGSNQDIQEVSQVIQEDNHLWLELMAVFLNHLQDNTVANLLNTVNHLLKATAVSLLHHLKIKGTEIQKVLHNKFYRNKIIII